MKRRADREPALVPGKGVPHEHVRTGKSADAIAHALVDNLHYLLAKLPQHASRNDWYMALAWTVRDRMLHHYVATVDATTGGDPFDPDLIYAESQDGNLMRRHLTQGVAKNIRPKIQPGASKYRFNWNI